MRTTAPGIDAVAMIAVQGPNAREKFWTAFPATRAATEPLGVFQAAECVNAATGWSPAPATPARTASRSPCRPAPPPLVWQEAARAGDQALRPGRARHPAPRSRHEPLRPGHGRGHLALRSRPQMDRGPQGPARDFIGKSALAATQPRNQFAGLLLLDRGVLRAHQKVITPQGEGEITSGSFSPSLNQSIALARLPDGRRHRQRSRGRNPRQAPQGARRQTRIRP
jgi:aminomethyltransferase